MVIQHNMASMFTNRMTKINTGKRSKTTERLSSGFRINRAADDAAGLSISEKLRWQVRGLNRAAQNIQDGISLLQVADGALTEVHSMLHRMGELAVQAANDTNTDADRLAIQEELDQIKGAINQISTDTTFNELEIFKPTNVPSLTGSPTDILIYHEDYNGGVREGGIIYNGKRYAYNTDIKVNLDANNNIIAGEYSFMAEGENGEVPITLLFDGGNRVPSGRKYTMEARDDGIYIDGIAHGWSQIKDAQGIAFDKNNIRKGTYSFIHAEMTVSFSVEDGTDFNSFKSDLKQDGLEAYVMKSCDGSVDGPRVNPSISMSNPAVNAANQNYIPGNTSTNSEIRGYRMHADDSGVYMYIDASDSNGQGRIQLDTMTWAQLSLDEWASGESVNPASTVSGGEAYRGYVYRDSKTNTTISFAVDSEVSKGELINAINNWRIDVDTNNKMIFTASSSGTGTTISIGSHSGNLDAYGTQYAMGRTMSTQLVLQGGMVLAHDAGSDSLSFNMTDAKGKTYTFSAGSVKNSIQSSVASSLNAYISNYASAYRTYLNNTQGGSGSPSVTSSYTGTLSLRDTANGYSVALQYDKSFSGWLNNSNFDVSYTTNPYTGRKSYTVTAKANLLSSLGTRTNTMVDNIYNALKGTTISAKTDNLTTVATTTITSTTPTRNNRYDSLVISSDREVKVQAGPLMGQVIGIKLPAMNTGILRIGGVNVTSHDSASAAIKSIDSAIDYISDMRAGYGATQNRLEHAMAINEASAENIQAAESRIRDADMAEEMVEFSANNILVQSGQSILAQSNRNPEQILMLLQ